MKIFSQILGWSLLLVGLTVLTQVGGIILLLCFPVFHVINRSKISKIQQRLIKFVFFTILYLFIIFLIIPPLAKQWGRVPLPVWENPHLKPAHIGYCLLNRHYVKPPLKAALVEVSEKFAKEFPGATVAYLDAGFPFWDAFPLLPHLSHDDGKKVDLAFLYLHKKSGKPSNAKPSLTGYGVFESPKVNEVNQIAQCKARGYWQYDINRYMGIINRKNAFVFDEARTKRLMILLTQNKAIGKILLEPHLKTRLKLHYNKVRFHGCQAARHDDHVHVQLR